MQLLDEAEPGRPPWKHKIYSLCPQSQLEPIETTETESTDLLQPFNGVSTPTKSLTTHNSSDNNNEENVPENALNVDLATPPHRKRKRYGDLTRSGKADKRQRVVKLLEVEEDVVDRDELNDLLRDIIAERQPRAKVQEARHLDAENMSEVLNLAISDAALRSEVWSMLCKRMTSPLSVRAQASALHTPQTSYRRHLSSPSSGHQAAATAAPVGRPRLPRIDTFVCDKPRREDLRNWLISNAPVKSGQLNYRALRDGSYADGWKSYSTMVKNPYELDRFTKILHDWGIHPAKYDQFACPKCAKKEPDEEHAATRDVQFAAHRAHKKAVELGKAAILVMDYCRIHELGLVQMDIEGEKRARSMKLSCLGIVLITASDSKFRSYHFDFFSASKQTGDFLQEAVDEFWPMFLERFNPDWRMIYLWADGGMENKANLAVLVDLQRRISTICTDWSAPHIPILQANFYAPYHGHNDCDAHFGRIKESIRRHDNPASRGTQAAITASQGLPDTFPTKLRDGIPVAKHNFTLSRVPLVHKSPDANKKENFKVKQHRCVLFDPYDDSPLLFYPTCASLLLEQPKRFRISAVGFDLYHAPPRSQNDVLPPWDVARDIIKSVKSALTVQ